MNIQHAHKLKPEDFHGKSIVLVGIMGAGKSSIGRRLGSAISLPFVDADTEIEKAAGQSISDIFETYGEDHFRAGEKKVISRLLGEKTQVIATGGGAFIQDPIHELIKQHAISIWLRVDFETVMERVKRRSHRPLLKQPNPEAVMQKLLSERTPIYQTADITVHSRAVPHEVIVDEIIDALQKHLGVS